MELIVTKVNGFQLFTFATKSSNLDFAVVLDRPLLFFITLYKLTKYDKRSLEFSADSGKAVQSKKKKSLTKSKQN